MSNSTATWIAIGVISGSCISVILAIYYGITQQRKNLEDAKNALGELQIDDDIKNESTSDLINDVNAEFSPDPKPSTPKSQ
jgi:hypothetical protein